jgi:rhodanese-related sulfurtransferase
MKKAIKQSLIILLIAVVLGLVANFINPDGIALVMDTEKYSTDVVENPTGEANTNQENIDLSNPNVPPTNQKSKNEAPVKISGDFAKQLFDRKAVFVDGRPAEEFAVEHIPGAINIPYVEIATKTPEEKKQLVKDINPNAVVVTYCSGKKCDISIDVAYELFDLGYTSVNIYLGGLEEWKEKGFPTEK